MDDYKLIKRKLVCIIGDNCSTNTKTADPLNTPLLGCRTHRFNIAIESYIKEFIGPEIDLVTSLMSKLSTLKEAGWLRLLTPLRPVRRNKTRWLGTINMIERYEQLLPFLNDPDPSIVKLLPDPTQRNMLRIYGKNLNDFKSIVETLLSTSITLLDTSLLFESLYESFSSFDFEKYLSPKAPIVHNPIFEEAIHLIQASLEHSMTQEEKDATVLLLQTGDEVSVTNNDDDSHLSFAQRALKRRQTTGIINYTYIDTRFLLPTSNHCERLFSMCKRVFSTKRRRLLHCNLEALVFLKQNRDLWNLASVSSILANMSELVIDCPLEVSTAKSVYDSESDCE